MTSSPDPFRGEPWFVGMHDTGYTIGEYKVEASEIPDSGLVVEPWKNFAVANAHMEPSELGDPFWKLTLEDGRVVHIERLTPEKPDTDPSRCPTAKLFPAVPGRVEYRPRCTLDRGHHGRHKFADAE